MEVTFRNPYEACTYTFSNRGETKKPVYTLVNKNGERSLKQIDEIDIPASINSFKASTDIRAMLKRYSLTGDPSILMNKKGGLYGDFTGVETNYAKLLDASRQLALLDLQAAARDQEMSEGGEADSGNGKDGSAAVTGSASGAAANITDNGNKEVNNE